MKDFNFFSPYIEDKKKGRKRDYAIAGIFLLAVVIAVSFTTYHMVTASKMEKQIAEMEAFIHDPENVKTLNEVKVKKAKLDILEEYTVIMEETKRQIEKGDRIHTAFLNAITATLPQELFFSMMTLSNTELSIQGVSDKMIPIAELEYNLRQLDRFNDIHVSNITKNEVIGKQIYSLKATLKDGDLDEDEEEQEEQESQD